MKDEKTKIITTEDPIEYQLEGINQIQVHPKVGLTFAASLRSILRHDPDVVLVGEIRDLETAESAVQASLTGHLVFSTLHTNDAAGAFMRLADMGVEPFLVCSTVEGVMAQRLVRTLCPECCESYLPAAEDVPEDFPWSESATTGAAIYRAVGCRQCRGTGYRGRTGIYELLVTNDEIRRLAAERTPTNLIKRAAMQAGMRTLRQDGWRQGLPRADDRRGGPAGDESRLVPWSIGCSRHTRTLGSDVAEFNFARQLSGATNGKSDWTAKTANSVRA